jgi:L-asparaginase
VLFKKIVVLGTGGTIAGTAANAAASIGYVSAQIGIQSLLEQLPQSLPGHWQWVSEQVAQVDSKDMDHALWQKLVKRILHWQQIEGVHAVLITHGTDTLEETAYFLHRVLQPSYPVVLTGAMRPSTFSQADGPQNMLDAGVVACDVHASGVMVVFAGDVHDARAVQKVHTQRLNAFDSGDIGPLARVQDRRVNWIRNPVETQLNKDINAIENIVFSDPASWPWVAVLSSHVGASDNLVDALVSQGVRGLVVAGTGNGTLHVRLLTALKRAAERGVVVWRTSRCQNGPVLVPENAQSGDEFPVAEGLNPYKARIDLMLHLMQTP